MIASSPGRDRRGRRQDSAALRTPWRRAAGSRIGFNASLPETAQSARGGISFLHRFGSALNPHVHLHDHLLRYCARPPFALERLSVIRGPPTDCGELVQMHDERGVFQATERRAARDRHPQPLSRAGLEVTTKRPAGRTRRDSALTPEKCHSREEDGRSGKRFLGSPRRDQPAPRGSRVVQQSGHACGSAIGRPILFIMTLRAS